MKLTQTNRSSLLNRNYTNQKYGKQQESRIMGRNNRGFLAHIWRI